MDEPKNILLPGFSDTGQWKLIIAISSKGILGILKNVEDNDRGVVTVLRENWLNSDQSFLKNVENVVYEHPQILDDFSTRIIIFTQKSIWVPTSFLETDEDEYNYLLQVFECEPEDVFADYGDEETCLFTTVPGLRSFLTRTLPGCKIESQVSCLRKEATVISGSEVEIIVNIRDEEVDVISFNRGNLVNASTHPFRASSDIAYSIMLVLDAFDLDNSAACVRLFGADNLRADTAQIIRKFVGKVEYIDIADIGSDIGADLTLALLLEAKKENYENHKR